MHALPLVLALLSALFATKAAAAERDEAWNLLLVDGEKAGYVHSVVEPTESGGHVTTIDSLFRIRRMGNDVKIHTTIVTTEGADGQVERIHQVADMAASETVQVGVVNGDRLEVTTSTMGREMEHSIDWPEDVPGPVEMERRRVAAGTRPGASVTFQQFDFTLGQPFEVTTTVLGEEEVELRGERRRLIKMRTTSDVLPETLSWIEPDGSEAKTSTSLMGMEITTVPASLAEVEEFVASGASAEMFLQSTIAANVRLPRPRSLTSVLYRLTPKSSDATFPDLEDERQRITSEGTTKLLRIDVVVPPEDRRQRRPIEDPPAELAEYLEPNAFLQSDDERLIAMARRGVGDETDAWRAAQKLEKFVQETIEEKTLDVAFATALEVCVDRRGDCSEHAVLLAALCRSAGIPSRVAMGLVYVPSLFGGHAWTEVSIDGEWYALDGTIGAGVVDPTHIRFGASSLHNGGLASGMLGIVQGLGAFDLQIVEYAHGDEVVEVDAAESRASVKDGVFHDRVEGLTFLVPDGWEVVPPSTDLLEMSNLSVVARLRSDASTGAIVVTSIPAMTSFDDFVRQLGGNPEEWERRTIAGRDGRVGNVRSDAGRVRIAAFQAGGTLFAVRAGDPDAAALEAFELVVGTTKVDR